MAINISTWRTLKLSDPHQQQLFIDQLVQYLSDVSSSDANSFNTLNKQVATINTQIAALVTDLGTLSTNPTVNCSGYSRVLISMNMGGAARTMTLTNLAAGTDVRIYVRINGLFIFKIIASDPSAVAYSIFAYWQGSGTGAKTNMTTTGWGGNVAGYDTLFVGQAMTQGGTNYLPLVTLSG